VEYEDRLTIATPEGVELDLTLAGLGSRFQAGIVDQLLKVVLIVAVALAFGGFSDLGIAVVVPMIALVIFAYDVLFELLGQGRTPGKRLAGLRVVRGSGAPVDLRASLVRNVLRLIDGWPLSYVPTIVLIMVTKRNQRLGDIAADTIVVRTRKGGDVPSAQLGPSLPSGMPPVAAPDWDVSGVGEEELVALRSFLDRRSTLERPVRAQIAAQLEAALRDRVGGATETDPERFLEGVAAAKLSRGR
jgi:uncharacterized RDD family membrane protein YckC